MKPSSFVASLAMVVALFTLNACGGDSTGPKTPKVDGTWSLTLTNMSGSGVSCNWSGATMTLAQNGTNFSGSYSGGTLTCTSGGESASGSVGSGAVINGTVSGNSVSFQLDSPDMPLTGTITDRSMSGTGILRYDFGEPYGVVTLNGNWGAAKRP